VTVIARPEPPRARFQSPSLPIRQQQLPRQEYGAPPQPPTRPFYGLPTPAPSYGLPALEPEITKSVFVHLPPENDNEIPQPQVLPVQPPKKHYKIIFIKAPEPPKFNAPIIPPQPQDEHKTLVYVLVKKPDEQQQIELPAPEATPPSKPEVYFIKYKQNEKPPLSSYGPPPLPEYGPPPTSSSNGNVDSNYNPSSEALAF
jgi:hypothetical protein